MLRECLNRSIITQAELSSENSQTSHHVRGHPAGDGRDRPPLKVDQSASCEKNSLAVDKSGTCLGGLRKTVSTLGSLNRCVFTLIHDLLFLPISTIESAVGKCLVTHCCVSRLACSPLSGHIEPHSPPLQA